MNNEVNFHDYLFAILKVMGFETFLRTSKVRGFVFNRDVFIKPNQKAFEHVSIFLFKQLKYTECLNELKGSYPCMDKKQEADFRKIIMKYLKKLESDPDFDHKFLPVLMHNPGGDQFVQLFLCFTNYVAKKVMLKDFSISNLSIDEYRSNSAKQQNLLEQTAKQFYDEKQELLNLTCEFTDKLINLKNELHENENELKRLTEKLHFCDMEQLRNQVFDQAVKIQKTIKPFNGWTDEMQTLLNYDFKNECMIVDGCKLSNDGQPIDIVKRFEFIKSKIEIFKNILHKDFSEIKGRNGELLSKISILSEIKEKLLNVNGNLANLEKQLCTQYEEQKKTYLERDDVQARIKRIADSMNINFPNIVITPLEPVASDDISNVVPEILVTSTTMKKKNRRVSMFDCEPSVIEMFDLSTYNLNLPSDNDLSFSPSSRPARRDSIFRYSAVFDRNIGF